jgi:hypothetical protein
VLVLTEAAIAAGLETPEIGPTIRSGLAKGKQEPRHIPDEDIAGAWWGTDEDHWADEAEPDASAQRTAIDRVYNGSELWDIEPTEFLIDGIVPKGTLGLMVGESQTFKSFMAQSMALSIAAGLPDWQGHALAAPPDAAVLYIAGEGGVQSAAIRMRAWAAQNGFEAGTLERFHLIAWQINLLDKSNYKRLLQACHAIGDDIAFIVVDTINTASAGADENSAQDMGTLYSVMRKLSQTFNAAIMGVHHTNKQGRTRGSNLLNQNADFTVFMSRPQRAWLTMNVEMHITKLKDAPSGDIEHFHLDLIPLADNTTSLAPKRIGATQAERTETTATGRPSSRVDAILKVLRDSQSIEGETRSEICAILNITEMKEKNAVAQALRRLLERGIVTRDKSKWQLVGSDFME